MTVKQKLYMNSMVAFFMDAQDVKDAFNPLARKLMHELYNYTIKRENDLKCRGYSVVSIWECQFECKAGIQINNIIKSNNRYKMISNGKFIFKDILAYLSQIG